MTETNKLVVTEKVSEQQRAIVEAGILIDVLADEYPNVQLIKDAWYQVGLSVRGAIAELRILEQEAQKNEVK